MNKVLHNVEPIFDEKSKILILGTMLSPKSRELAFYYGHPQNRFWRILAKVLDEDLASTNEAKKDMILRNNIALWDVIKSCKIDGAKDSSISDVIINDFSKIFDFANIEAVFCTGRKAESLYNEYIYPKNNFLKAIYLPSTSPANRAFNNERLIFEYSKILEYLK